MLWKAWVWGVVLILLYGTPQAFARESAYCDASIVATQAARGDGAAAQAPEHGWVNVQLPDYWSARWPDHDGIVWYRIQWVADCDPAELRTQPLALAINSINMAGQIFVNGDLLWRDTHLVEPLSRSWNMPRTWTLPAAATKTGINTILVQVHGASVTSPGLGAVLLGDPLELRERQRQATWNHRTMFTIDMMGSTFIACLFLAMWLFYRKAGLYIWFASLNLFWVAFLYNVTATETWPFSSTAEIVRANAIAFMLFCMCFTNFMFRLANRPPGRGWTTLTIVFTACMSIAVAIAPDDVLVLAVKTGVRSHLLLFVFTCLALVWIPLRSRKADDWLYGGMSIFYCVIGFHDWRAYYLQLESAPLTPFANLVTVTGIAFILGLRIAHSMRRIERFNEELNVAVVDACTELEHSLQKKHELALTNTKLQERVELIQDIHDGFGSALVRAITLAEVENSSGQHKSKHVSTLKSLRDDLRLVIDSGRNFSENVPSTPQAWIAPTRYRFSTLFDHIDIKCQWCQPPTWRSPPTAMMCLTLTRFLEEALSNVLKHSGADTVHVIMKYPTDHQIVLEIQDNGVGFDVARAYRDETGVGLHSMQTRLARLEGAVEILSGKGKTVVRATVCAAGVRTLAAE